MCWRCLGVDMAVRQLSQVTVVDRGEQIERIKDHFSEKYPEVEFESSRYLSNTHKLIWRKKVSMVKSANKT
jgi:hypothetical protein